MGQRRCILLQACRGRCPVSKGAKFFKLPICKKDGVILISNRPPTRNLPHLVKKRESGLFSHPQQSPYG